MKNTIQNREWVERQFRKSTDWDLRMFADSKEPSLSILAELLVDHIDDKKVRIRYMKRGLSGAGVLLLLPTERLAKVVKFGPRKEISFEKAQFDKNIRGHFPLHLAAFATDDNLVRVGREWASFCYWWSGGYDDVRQLNELLARTGFVAGRLTDLIEDLIATVFAWSRPLPRKTPNKPSEMMPWRFGSKRRIQYALEQSTHAGAPSLLRFLDGHFAWSSNAIGTRKFSMSARCHGDINYRNLVFAGSNPALLRVCLIDFGSLKRNMCAAYDWSKLERDIRFKCVRELWAEPATFTKVLGAIDNCMLSGSLSAFDALPAHVDRVKVQAILTLMSAIQDTYIRLATPFSDLPQVEYLWFLLYRWLGLLDAKGYPDHDETTRMAIIESACSIYEALQRSISDDSFSQVQSDVLKAIGQIGMSKRPTSESDFTRNQFELSCMGSAVVAAHQSTPEDQDPHPRVGVVVAKHQKVIETSYRGKTGIGDHAEFGALEKTLPYEPLAGATVYTTLEPCTDRRHQGLACAQHLLERRVARVVIGMLNPNPKKAGKGMFLLQQAGVEVELFPKQFVDEILELNRSFIRSHSVIETRADLESIAGTNQYPQMALDFLGTWHGSWHRSDGESGKELIHVMTQSNDIIGGTFFDVESPEVPVVFEGTFRHPYLRVRFHSPYTDSKGKRIMEDGSCFLTLQDDGAFAGCYADFKYHGTYEFRRA